MLFSHVVVIRVGLRRLRMFQIEGNSPFIIFVPVASLVRIE